MIDLELWHYGLLIFVGFFSGIVNVMAGGGSVITVPIMMFLGLPGPVANGTNRVTILAHNAGAIATYVRYGVPHRKLCLSLTIVALPAAWLGAWLSTRLSHDDFTTLLAIIMVGVLVAMHLPSFTTKQQERDEPKNLVTGHLLMVFAGFWGGFIQIGMGFIVLPILHRVIGLTLVTTNIFKVFIIFSYTALALMVFLAESEIIWLVGLVAAVGNIAGGVVGAKLTLAHGDRLIRIIFFVAIIAMVIKLVFFS